MLAAGSAEYKWLEAAGKESCIFAGGGLVQEIGSRLDGHFPTISLFNFHLQTARC